MPGGSRIATSLLGLSIFATGFCGLVSEFLLSTLSSYILGNSVEQFSIVIALMMLMMGVAGAVQRFFPDSRLVEQFVLVEMLLALLGGFAPLLIYAAYGHVEDHFLLVHYGAAMAIGFLIGFELPLVLRINERYSQRLPDNLALILGLDYVGGFVGALVWTRFLLREIPLTEASFFIASFNFAIAVLTFAWFAWQGHVRQPALAAVGIAIVAGALGVGMSSNRGWNETLEQRLYDDRIVFAETTRFQRIVITHHGATDDTRLFLNGNLQLSSLDEAVYHEQLVHPAMSLAPRRRRVLVLGGGDGMALREILLYPDVESVVLVDLDPRMTELAASEPRLVSLNRGAFADARVRVVSAQLESLGTRTLFQEETAPPGAPAPEPVEIGRVEVWNVDADRFLGLAPGVFDVIIVDLPDPSSVELAKLYSREFYRKLARALAPDGVVALQATSPYHAREAFLCIQRTLESAGLRAVPYHDHVASFGSWGFLLAGRMASAPDDLRAGIAALEAFDVETRYLTPDVLRASLTFGKGRLDSRFDDVNTLLQPVLLDRYLRESWLVD